jgi:hypothetical protein
MLSAAKAASNWTSNRIGEGYAELMAQGVDCISQH